MPRVFGARIEWLFAAALVAGSASLSALDMPNLSGKWFLNRDASDSPEAATRDGSDGQSGSGFHGGGGGMGHGRGGHRGHSAAPSDGGNRASDDGGSMREAYARAQTLEIRHDEPRLSVTDAGGRERVYYTDGRKAEEEHSFGGTTKISARWKDGRVEVVSTPEKGPRITETYAVTADHSQLTVTTTIQGGRRDVTFRRVYQSTPPTAPPAAAPGKGQPEPEPDPAEDAVV